MAHFNLDDYETVESRLEKFWKDHPNGRIFTDLISFSDNRYIVKAFIFRNSEDIHPWATGLAEETIQGRGVNATSALENGETSALGRALAGAGYAAKGKRPSREEMIKVAEANKVKQQIEDTKIKMAQTSGSYVPVPAADDPWKIVPTKQGQTLGEAVEVLGEMMGAQLVQPEMVKCKHGDMRWNTGTTKTGKPWGQYKCTSFRVDQCRDVIWYSQQQGKWVKQVAK